MALIRQLENLSYVVDPSIYYRSDAGNIVFSQVEGNQPIDFGVMGTCSHCGNCASACPVGAISLKPAPSSRVKSISNNPGIKRWTIDPEKCYSFWVTNGACCSNCIAACPYTPRTG